MLLDFHNLNSTRRSFIFSLFLFALSMVSTEKENDNLINLYLLAIDAEKIAFLESLSGILFFICVYFFAVYYSYLYNNENNILEDLSSSRTFKMFDKTYISMFKFIYLYLYDCFTVRNFAVHTLPLILFLVVNSLYLGSFFVYKDSYIVAIYPMFFLFTSGIYILSMKYLVKKYALLKKKKNPYKAKYDENKKYLFLKRKK